MRLLILDILIYSLTKYKTYLVLLNFSFKNKIFKWLYIIFTLDFIVFNSYYKYLIIFIMLFILNKYILKYNNKILSNFLSINIINYCLFIILSNLINRNFDFASISKFIVDNFILNFIIWIIFYFSFISKI